MGTFGWLWTVLIVSSAMFILGVLVGRGAAPVGFDIDALQKELAALKQQALKDESSRYRIDPGVGNDNPPDLDFHEALKRRKPRAETLPVKPKPVEKVPAPPSPPPPRVSKAAPAESAVAATEADESRTMTLQVASLKDSKAADRIVASLAAKGYPVYRVAAQVPGKGLWYRVRVGAFKDAEEAELIMDKLKKEGRSPILVKRE